MIDDTMKFYVCADEKADMVSFLDVRLAIKYADSLPCRSYIVYGYLLEISDEGRKEKTHDNC